MSKLNELSISIFISVLLFSFSSVNAQTKTLSKAKPSPTAKSNTSSIQGSWEVIEQKFTSTDSTSTTIPFRSIIIFTDKFYSITYAIVDRSSWPNIPAGEKASYENLENAFHNFVSNAGRYEIKGDSIMYNVVVSKHPNYMNDVKSASRAFELNGDKLITHTTSATGQKRTTTYKRMK
jgi:hypothetical protein